jgi:hypothetical protein
MCFQVSETVFAMYENLSTTGILHTCDTWWGAFRKSCSNCSPHGSPCSRIGKEAATPGRKATSPLVLLSQTPMNHPTLPCTGWEAGGEKKRKGWSIFCCFAHNARNTLGPMLLAMRSVHAVLHATCFFVPGHVVTGPAPLSTWVVAKYNPSLLTVRSHHAGRRRRV